MGGVMLLLKRESQPSNLVYIGELLHGQTFSPKMVHVLTIGSLIAQIHGHVDAKQCLWWPSS